MVNIGVKHGMKESLLEGVSLTPLYIGYPLVKGSLFVCTIHVVGRSTILLYDLIICRYMGVWVELYRMVMKAI